MSEILKKLELYLEKKYDNPEFYKKDIPESKTLIEKIISYNFSKTKKMRRGFVEHLSKLAECTDKRSNKLWEAIYATAVDQGKVIMEMDDGDKKEPIPEDEELNEEITTGQKYRNKQGSILEIGEINDGEVEIICKDKDAPSSMVISDIENLIKSGAVTLLTESKKEFIGDCVSNPLGKEIYDVKDGGEEISKNKFISACDIDPEILKDMKQYPNDYEYFYNKDKDIYFYKHSSIEYFYK